MMNAQTIHIAILGLGTVGGATYDNLERNRAAIEDKCGFTVSVKWILELDPAKYQSKVNSPTKVTSDLDCILNDPEVSIVVELIGGKTFAKEALLRALKSGKHVVTANKALLAEFGREILEISRTCPGSLFFEAAVAGGIPIIKSMQEGFAGNVIETIQGILNGTCNYILTEMEARQMEFPAILKDAKDRGYAEADPSFDIEGVDAAHKITILAGLAYGTLVDFKDLKKIRGITRVTLQDIKMAAELGYVIRLIASASRQEDGLDLRVEPCLVGRHHPLAAVEGVYNAVFVEAFPVGRTMFYGRGAGGEATSSAVIADILQCASNQVVGGIDSKPYIERVALGGVLAAEGAAVCYYIRIRAKDEPGVLAKVAGILGRHQISIASVNQKNIHDEETCVPVILVTHEAGEKNMALATEEILGLEDILEEPFVMPIIE